MYYETICYFLVLMLWLISFLGLSLVTISIGFMWGRAVMLGTNSVTLPLGKFSLTIVYYLLELPSVCSVS